MGIYGIAKVTTIIEMLLLCNWLLLFEFIGLIWKTSRMVMIGIIFRCILILFYTVVDRPAAKLIRVLKSEKLHDIVHNFALLASILENVTDLASI